MSPETRIVLHVNGVKAGSQEEIEKVLEKQSAKEKKGSKSSKK
jgi:hypothetical protein